ncbi:putative alpha-ketoglutarate-dependent sulfonate dioxygenase [Gonapodya prolifera JEL478]|uniref:Putative alpha-ketoglutarate-dependent sulfonate dioxygenase n=1 Tax=Gonapodya prolifera (strain JEL478) TaxID=1344416 RepID=A0A139A7D7_GONPJ|nr:putative alpha-ketoglutarate-dependent sulfonate dioxygenase [Gonapodya prolifera JEL478]|eukprot:KXS12283.1 putative alpha-ketoglutarate-dependent sulfonate dioxygenase [Gonapodya prolifera JEL478]
MPPVATETNGHAQLDAPAESKLAPALAKLSLTPSVSRTRPRPTVTREESAALSDVAPKDIEEKLFPRFIDASYPPIPVVEVNDRAKLADPKKSALLGAATKIIHITPTIGTELHGLQLSKLTLQQKDELALLAAERGVVFFRDQDITVEEQLDLGRYYGPLHIHHTTGAPKDFPEVHVVYADENTRDHFATGYPRQRAWHTDVSYERQPPGVTTLKQVTVPHVGGDTLWVNTYQAYETLPAEYKDLIEGRTAIHSGVEQSNNAVRAGHPLKRAAVENEHPIVRTHPVTGWKALYVNPQFTTRIVGLPADVSERVLKFLYDHISNGEDFKVRLRWQQNTVAVWDNRNTIHYAINDYFPARRHGVRVTPHAEAPFYDPNSKGQFEDLVARGFKGGAVGF